MRTKTAFSLARCILAEFQLDLAHHLEMVDAGYSTDRHLFGEDLALDNARERDTTFVERCRSVHRVITTAEDIGVEVPALRRFFSALSIQEWTAALSAREAAAVELETIKEQFFKPCDRLVTLSEIATIAKAAECSVGRKQIERDLLKLGNPDSRKGTAKQSTRKWKWSTAYAVLSNRCEKQLPLDPKS